MDVRGNLTGPGASMVGIDLFEGTYDIKYPAFGDRYFANVAASGVSEKVTSIKGFSQIELRKMPLDSYDIIYIDGSHENHDTLEDAVLSWRLLKSGGVLIFDDYGRREPQFSAPKSGIDTFFRFFGDKFIVLHNDHQVFLKKK